MTPTPTSRERLLAALSCQQPDRTPCAFMMYKGLKNRCTDYRQFLEAQVALGLDTIVELPPRPPVVVNDHYNLHGLPVAYDPRVRIREWMDADEAGGSWLVKEYETPDGALRAEVPRTRDWPWGEHVPFLDDHIVPNSRKYLVDKPGDLKALRHLLVPPTPPEIETYRQESQPYLDFAREHGLLVAGGWGVGADMVGWLCGLQNLIFMTYRQPDFLHELLGIIADWNYARMQAAFSLPLDLYIKRAWYENCDFWTPGNWQEFLQPILRREADLAHENGVKFGYLITSQAMPLVDLIIEVGVDVLIGVDPREYDLEALARKAKGRLCLWGGVNGHLTVEGGAPRQVAQEVGDAMRRLAHLGGFILSPVDNVREYSPEIEKNVQALIESWERLR
jgi:uroporphyrinogen-III decarboxylase